MCVIVAGVSPHQIACIGISAQRSSFVTWHRETGKPFHNFVTWRDVRADGLVQQWNDSLTMKVCLLVLLNFAESLCLAYMTLLWVFCICSSATEIKFT
jgi:sugar (pentulose or hexulose) kinase